jgi:hypothetical protein
MSDDTDYGQKFIRGVNATPLPRDLFMELIQITIEARSGKRRTLPPDAERCLEDAPPGTLYLTDCPENQMGMSIVGECHRRFSDDRERAEAVSQSFLFRWFAICKARESGRLKGFIKRDKNIEMVYTSIFEAAADCPLTMEGDFDDSYVERARAIKAAEGD